MLLAHGGSGGLEMFVSGGYVLLVALVLIGAVVVGRMTRYDRDSAETCRPPLASRPGGRQERERSRRAGLTIGSAGQG